MIDSLRTFCLADSTIAGLLGTRLFVGSNPNDPPVYPYTCMLTISGGSQDTADNRPVWQERVQLDHVGSPAQTDALRLAFRNLLHNFSGAVSSSVRSINIKQSNVFGPTLLPDPANVHKLSQDFMINYAE